jgi:hypothetical protein
MATVDALNAPPLEFVHARSAADIVDAEGILGDGGVPIRDLEPLMPAAAAVGMAPDHVFVLRQGEAVATLRAGDVRRLRIALPPDVEPPGDGVVLHRLAAIQREGTGCSYRLVLLLWAAEWLTAHAGVRTLSGICRADALYRYTPLGFRPTSRWFAAGPTRHGVVVVQANAINVVSVGRSLGLQHILNSAVTASDGRSTLPASRATAA